MEDSSHSGPIEMTWGMFECVSTLGQGAYGDVFKVKCLRSTCVATNGTERVLLTEKQVKKLKAEMTMKGSTLKPIQNRAMLEGNYYVTKVINVEKVPQEVGLEALKEIEFMQSLDSPYIVGYFESFIENQMINIVIEYCPYGDLNTLVQKQKALNKAFVENIVWKIFINICLGVWTLHSAGMIHRDLKTLNIFMATQSVAKIGDLGCAKRLNASPIKEASPKKVKPQDMEADMRVSMADQ